MHFRFTAPLWQWDAKDGWFFVTLPNDAADQIAELPGSGRGFGSVRVRVTVGDTSWSTSVFPDTSQGSYVLPMKKAVRSAEGLAEGDDVDVALDVVDA
ncbi:hypothetical protein N802_11350 [Knoellia sinensis KCTC 19936]|uniref:DUF1905 domain-containing protein n=1 Tax=Knoellia sinensis KCTC 19936 TaxID=1385520 RepID=A0A0A0J287_9MICO|nr:DUF1905 domain-containing protein [Knoellia sinensis]KGN29771.1 hypothetical protein N802_11350 [Knoellia sinensis KCTC 19936]